MSSTSEIFPIGIGPLSPWRRRARATARFVGSSGAPHLAWILLLLASLARADATPNPVAGAERCWDARHFRITSEIEISAADLRRVATVADQTARAVAAHPIPWFDPPWEKRPELRICGDSDRYLAAGGLEGTAGWYLPRQRAVLLDATHLFPAPAGSRTGALPDEAMVVHEIVHLCMHRSQGRMPQWLAEGICEYFAAAHQGGGRFEFAEMEKQIRGHLLARFGERPQGIPILPFASLLGLDHRAWTAALLRLPADRRYEGYSSALLLAHYHLHGPSRREVLREAFASRPPTLPDSLQPTGEAIDEMTAMILQFWAARGLRLQLTEPPPD